MSTQPSVDLPNGLNSSFCSDSNGGNLTQTPFLVGLPVWQLRLLNYDRLIALA
jgi:hypothetical protein